MFGLIPVRVKYVVCPSLKVKLNLVMVFFFCHLSLIIAEMCSDGCFLRRLTLKLVLEAACISGHLQLQECVVYDLLNILLFFLWGGVFTSFVLNKVSIPAEESKC